jgi:hypothetical protein
MTSIFQLRTQAAARGETTINTGKPCKHGHYSPRYVSTGGCIQCLTVTVLPKYESFDGVAGYATDKLLTLKNSTHAERIELRLYLQRCIFDFWKHRRGGTLPDGAQMAADYYNARLVQAEIDDPRNKGE